MPVTTRIMVSPAELRVDDIITEVEFPNSKVISGKTKLAGARVEGVSTGKANATIKSDRGIIIVKRGADVHVRREVPTVEEEAERKVESDRRYRVMMQHALLKMCCDMINEPQGLQAEIATTAAEVTSNWVGQRLVDLSQDLFVANEMRTIALDILQTTGHTKKNETVPMDIVAAAGLVQRKLIARMIDNGVDDTWSGRGNDLRRMVFDAKRKFVADLKWKVELA